MAVFSAYFITISPDTVNLCRGQKVCNGRNVVVRARQIMYGIFAWIAQWQRTSLVMKRSRFRLLARTIHFHFCFFLYLICICPFPLYLQFRIITDFNLNVKTIFKSTSFQNLLQLRILHIKSTLKLEKNKLNDNCNVKRNRNHIDSIKSE